MFNNWPAPHGHTPTDDDDRFEQVPPPSYLTDHRPMRLVESLHVEGSVDVYVRRGSVPALTVAAEFAEDFAKVKTAIKGDSLVVSAEGAGGTIIVGNVRMVFHGSVGSINGVQVGGFKGKVVVGVVLPVLAEVSVRGSADVTLIDLAQPALELDIQGSGDIYAQGQVDMLRADIAGSGSVKAKRLNARQAVLKVAGSGDIKAWVQERVKARVAGSGDIKIFGNPPQRDTHVAGSGDVRFK